MDEIIQILPAAGKKKRIGSEASNVKKIVIGP